MAHTRVAPCPRSALAKRPRPRCVHPTFIVTSIKSPLTPSVQPQTACSVFARNTAFLPARIWRPIFPGGRGVKQTYQRKHSIPTAAARSEQIRENLVDVSEPVIKAVETLSRQPRQTVADIAAAAGLPLTKAADEAVKLAALTGAAIDVSESGDIAYRFPSDVRGALRSRSFRAALAMTWRRIAPALFTASRIGFGALLIISIVVTFVAIAVLSAAATRDDERRESRSTSMYFGPRLFFGPDIFDVMFYSQRYGYGRRRYDAPGEREEGMSFLEAVYSFVFGDGDPNVDFEDRRWRAVATLIRANRGAVTADQLAPLLDPPTATDAERQSAVVDESFVLPALTRFQGRPEVTEDGDIVYVFPQFMTSGARTGSVEILGERSIAPAIEQEEKLTQASPSQRALVVTLGVINVLGVLTLGAKLGTVIPVTRNAAQFLAMIRGIYPALCAYAASFVAAPIFRFFRMKRRNQQIRARNDARTEKARAMQRQDATVRRKLRAAERYIVEKSNVSSDDVVYSSDRDVLDQIKAQDELKDDFDRRLNV